ncbi:MAG: MTH1187 family thiamine-binding protein [Thermodesulfobacteriota bacterium]
MLAQFSITPVGKGESLGDAIAGVLRIVDSSGLAYKANAMGTVVEGDWDDVMGLIKRCHDEVMKSAPRLISCIQIDLRPGKPLDRLTEKLKSVEKRLDHPVKQ